MQKYAKNKSVRNLSSLAYWFWTLEINFELKKSFFNVFVIERAIKVSLSTCEFTLLVRCIRTEKIILQVSKKKNKSIQSSPLFIFLLRPWTVNLCLFEIRALPVVTSWFRERLDGAGRLERSPHNTCYFNLLFFSFASAIRTIHADHVEPRWDSRTLGTCCFSALIDIIFTTSNLKWVPQCKRVYGRFLFSKTIDGGKRVRLMLSFDMGLSTIVCGYVNSLLMKMMLCPYIKLHSY